MGRRRRGVGEKEGADVAGYICSSPARPAGSACPDCLDCLCLVRKGRWSRVEIGANSTADLEIGIRVMGGAR
jgi:hypothetical protein